MKPVQHEVVVRVPELKERTAQLKRHFEENKDLYVTGIGGFALGYILRKPKKIEITTEITPTFVMMVPDV